MNKAELQINKSKRLKATAIDFAIEGAVEKNPMLQIINIKKYISMRYIKIFIIIVYL